MSGVSPIVARIRERVEAKKEELKSVNWQLAEAQNHVANLTVKATAIEVGIAEDEALLHEAEPKAKRAKKVQTLGQQIGTDAKEGQA